MTEQATRSDGDLLGDFAATGSEVAFGELVTRHGPMVHSVCRRVLSDHHEAKDVAQAVFLTLAKKARMLKGDSSVGGWLHRVAWCLAMDVHKARERRNRHEEMSMRETSSEEIAPVDTAAFRAELDAAVAGLPDRFRQPVVMFHMEERSAEETARALGLNPVTLRTRLVRAREMLRRKLVRRGVAVGSVGALTTLLSAEAGAAVLPATFVSATVKAANLAAAGKLAAGVGTGVVSANVAGLTKGAVKMMLVAKLKMVAAGVVVCALAAGSAVVLAVVAADGAIGTESDVPLATIWAFDMPGTRAIDCTQDGGGKWRAPEGPLADRISGAINGREEKQGLVYVRLAPKIETAFVVPGAGLDGLRTARDVLVDGQPAAVSVRAGAPASVFFFTKTSSFYVHIRRVTVSRQAVTIQYAFVPHETKEVTAHFALIPLPALAQGRYRVQLRGELDERWRAVMPNLNVDETANRVVCRLGEFAVTTADASAIGQADPATGKVAQVQWEGRNVLALFVPAGAQETMVIEEDGVLRGWDVAGGKLLREVKGLGYLTAATFSADGRLALIASPRSRPRILDAATGKQVQEIAITEDLTQAVAFSRDSAQAFVLARGRVYVYSVSHAQLVRTFAPKPDWGHIAFSPTGRQAISYCNVSAPSELTLWDLGQIQTSGSFRTTLTALGPGSVAISPDGTKVLLGRSGPLHLYDLAAEKNRDLAPAGAGRVSPGSAFSPDGRWVGAVVEGKAQLYRIADGKWFELAGGIEGAPNQVAFASDQKHVAVACGPTPAPPVPPGTPERKGDPHTRLYLIPISGVSLQERAFAPPSARP